VGRWVTCKRVYVRVHRYLCVIRLRESVVCMCVCVCVCLSGCVEVGGGM
jgi:hypothetical protein